MSWDQQKARYGNHELLVWKEFDGWKYVVNWNTKTAITTVGTGSETYADVHDARHAALLHLANILPKPQSQRLLADQGNLVWQPWFDPRNKECVPSSADE